MRIRELADRILYGGTKAFRDYERLVIRSFVSQLPDLERSVLENQLESVRLIQRFHQGKQVVVHLRGATSVLGLESASPEVRMADAFFENRSIRCGIVFSFGRLSSLEFSAPPGTLARIALGDVKVVLRECLNAPPKAAAIPPKGGVLERLAKVADLEEVLAPRENPKILGMVSPVPRDLAQLLAECDGFRAGSWTFYGSSPRTIVLEHTNYFLFAEDGEKALCIPDGESSPHIHLYDQVNDDVLAVTPTFVAPLLDMLREEFSRASNN
ncbi:MAG: hypothetical protein KC416_08600 [Myxococcales bacterium]|nr:hypothetical protein [Myxococcales bacterium]